MGLFDAFFSKKMAQALQKSAGQCYQTFTAYQPVFSSWGGQIYENMLIRAAIEAGARHASKLRVEFHGAAKPALRAAMKAGPNEYQTWPKFLARLWTLRNVNNTAFVIPKLNEYGEIAGYFPVLANNVTMVENLGKPYLQYFFANGNKGAMEFEKCAVLPKYQYADDFFGENNSGALRSTMQLVEMQNQAIQEAIKSSAAIRFMARMTNFAKAKDAAKQAQEFTESMLQGQGGGAIMLYPNTWDSMTQIHATPYTVDAAQMKQITDNVTEYFGTSEKLIRSEAIGDELDAFWEGQLEPFAIMLADEMTHMTYTPREIAQGNYVAVTANRLQYMSTTNKISLAKEMGDRGVLMEDEIRELFNYSPLGEENGGKHRPIRGEYYFADVGRPDMVLAQQGEGDKNDDERKTDL